VCVCVYVIRRLKAKCGQNLQHKKGSGTILCVCVCVCVCAGHLVLLHIYVVGTDILEANILCCNF
jgi:hypothetical protein